MKKVKKNKNTKLRTPKINWFEESKNQKKITVHTKLKIFTNFDLKFKQYQTDPSYSIKREHDLGFFLLIQVFFIVQGQPLGVDRK